MQILRLFKFSLLTSLIISCSLSSNAQVEIDGGICASQLKSNRKNYDSKYKPPDWWVEAWKWAKAFTDIFYGGGKKNSIDHQYENHGLAEFKPAESKYYFSYGIGVGIGTRGGKYEFGNTTEKSTIYYLQIPGIMARFNYRLNNHGELFAAAGPYYALALGGRYKGGGNKENLKFGNDAVDDYRRGDWGLKFRAGYKLSGQPIAVGFRADWGLRNITPGGNSAAKIKNQTLGLLVSYEF